MTETNNTPSEWLTEILSYLLGRPSTSEGTYALPRALEPVPDALTWWMFKGKRFEGLDQALGASWENITEEIKRLRQMFSPRLRVVDHAVEPVDWMKTYLRSGGNRPREFVVQSSGMGVSQLEWDSLCAWCAWITPVWSAHAQAWGPSTSSGHAAFLEETGDMRLRGLPHMDGEFRKKWLRITMRSRWPLLRNIVAESLKCMEVDETIDRVPLPKTRSDVFELLGMVRLIRLFQPDPLDLGWLAKNTGHTLSFPNGTFNCKTFWNRQAVIDHAYGEGGLPGAMRHYNLRVHCQPDLLCSFTADNGGFTAMIVEFKSMALKFSDALHQLRMYRAAAKAQGHGLGRLILWGIVENETSLSNERRAWLREQVKGSDDIWVFTRPDLNELEAVLHDLGLIQNVKG